MLKIKAAVRTLLFITMSVSGNAMAQEALASAERQGATPGNLYRWGEIPSTFVRNDDLGGFGRPSGEPFRLGPQDNGAYDMDRDFNPRPWPENLRAHEHREASRVRRFPTPVPFPNNPPLQVPGTSDFPWLRLPARPGDR